MYSVRKEDDDCPLVKEAIRRVLRAHKNWERGKNEAFQTEREQALSLFDKFTDVEEQQFPTPMKDWLLKGSLIAFGGLLPREPLEGRESVASVPQVFQELAEIVHREWNELNYDEKVFHEVATRALIEIQLHNKIAPLDPARWAAHSLSIPNQRDREQKFGEPPITVYRGDRFDIEIYYWLDGTTSIHEHGFCGAFAVLDGSSIHSRYGFNEKEVFNSRLAIGDLNLIECELLKSGDVRPIIAGEELIHALFHLERPSVSVVIRTTASWVLPQRHFLKPRIAIASILAPDETSRFQCLNMLGRLGNPSYIDEMQLVLNSCPPDEFVHLLVGLRRHLGHSDHLSITLDKLIPERRGLLKEVIAAIKDQKRAAKLSKFRACTSDVEERFLLALLLNLSECEMFLKFVRDRWPDEMPISVMDRIFQRMFERELEPPFGLPDHEQCANICTMILSGSTIESFDSDLRDTAIKVAKNSIFRPFVSP